MIDYSVKFMLINMLFFGWNRCLYKILVMDEKKEFHKFRAVRRWRMTLQHLGLRHLRYFAVFLRKASIIRTSLVIICSERAVNGSIE
ncbi:hypothetical protein [Vibrio furnissii]|uniref:hypothetical protein n=1 Tax=Vibrio furnissii TaxID=29494 RepID=UPI001EEA140D|nr:hypothetical protein [Vibrio furnissii]